MKRSNIAIVLFGMGILTLQCGGAPQFGERENVLYISKTFNKGYEEVWKALEEILVEDLMYRIKTKDKERGIIETDWISVIRIRGVLRWNLRVLLNRKEKGTEVKIYSRVEEPSEVVGKLKRKDKIKDGWQASEERLEDDNNILKMLSVRLEQ